MEIGGDVCEKEKGERKMVGCRETVTAKSRDKQRDRKIADGRKCWGPGERTNSRFTFPSSILDFKIESAMKYLYKFSVDFPTHCSCTVDSGGGWCTENIQHCWLVFFHMSWAKWQGPIQKHRIIQTEGGKWQTYSKRGGSNMGMTGFTVNWGDKHSVWVSL